MLARDRILLVTDAAAVARPPAGERDRTKLAVLEQNFRRGADAQVRGRRVTVYERIAPGRAQLPETGPRTQSGNTANLP
jgi:mannosyltransferase